jgi:hypothetical protein
MPNYKVVLWLLLFSPSSSTEIGIGQHFELWKGLKTELTMPHHTKLPGSFELKHY